MTAPNILINPELEIPQSEITFRFSRSGGPGGQNVNRVESRVELLFDLKDSPSLTEDQRRILTQKLITFLDSEGILHIVAQTSRSQIRNREEALARFQALMAIALKPTKKRRPTRPSRSSKEERLKAKKSRGRTKESRKKPDLE